MLVLVSIFIPKNKITMYHYVMEEYQIGINNY